MNDWLLSGVWLAAFGLVMWLAKFAGYRLGDWLERRAQGRNGS